MKTAVIYTCHLEGRISEPDNERQTMLCKEFAQQNGIEIVGSYMNPTRNIDGQKPFCNRRRNLQTA